MMVLEVTVLAPPAGTERAGRIRSAISRSSPGSPARPEFTTWFLVQKKLIQRTRSPLLAITADGVEHLEAHYDERVKSAACAPATSRRPRAIARYCECPRAAMSQTTSTRSLRVP